MSQEWSKGFYNSDLWQRVRAAYIASVCGLCESCNKAGVIVHHKRQLTPGNINDPDITLDWGNLKLLCLECHNQAHGNESTAAGLMFTGDGALVRA